MQHKSYLENGVRVLVEPVSHVGSASVGLWCVTGSTNEEPREAGITHFIEHMLFKGTKTRTSKQIAEEIEGRGGHLNAFTDKEATCYYCHVLDRDVEKAIEVLGEMLTDSLLADNDIKTEKGVVLEEIKRGEDEPGDHVHDLHLDYRWPNHPIGRPVIGHAQAVSSFSRDDLVNYISRRYMGGRVVLSVAGNVDPAVVEGAAKKALSKLQPGGEVDTLPKELGTPAKNEVAKDVEQVHFCIGTDGCTFYDEDRFPAIVCDGVLGSGMSSRLFQEVREKRGLAYAIGSYELTYRSAGAFTVYGGTGADKWEEVQAVVQGEFDKIAKSGVPDEELERTKRMIAGNIVLALESMSSRMMRMARNEITFGREIPVMETVSKIEAVTNDQIVAFASQRLAADKISTTAIGPFK